MKFSKIMAVLLLTCFISQESIADCTRPFFSARGYVCQGKAVMYQCANGGDNSSVLTTWSFLCCIGAMPSHCRRTN